MSCFRVGTMMVADSLSCMLIFFLESFLIGPVLVYFAGDQGHWFDPRAFVAVWSNLFEVLMGACVNAHLFLSEVKLSDEISNTPKVATKLSSESDVILL